MVLVFIILCTIIFTMLILITLLLSTLKIEIKNFEKFSQSIRDDFENEKLGTSEFLKISVIFLKKIPILVVKLDKKKINKIRCNKKFKSIHLKKIKEKFKEQQPSKKQILQAVKNIKIKIEKLNLRVYLGTEDSLITSYVTAFIASIIGITLPHLASENINNCKYEITPIYQNKNEYYINIDGILCIKIVHIISNMLILTKKGRDKKYE